MRGVDPLAMEEVAGGVWAHPAFARLVDDGAAVRALHGTLRGTAGAGVRAAERNVKGRVEAALLMFGSAMFGRRWRLRADTDFVLRVRFHLEERADSLEGGQEAIAPAVAALLEEMTLGLDAMAGVRVLRLHTTFTGVFVRGGPAPEGATIFWSPAAVARGAKRWALGEVRLERAARHAQGFKVALLVEEGGVLRPVEVAIEYSFTAPGGLCDICSGASGVWFGKAAFSRGEAETAGGMERQMGALFPGRYETAGFAREVVGTTVTDTVRRGKGVKAVKQSAVLRLLEGDGAGFAAVCALLEEDEGRALACDMMAERVGQCAVCAVERELGVEDLGRLLRETAGACPGALRGMAGEWLGDGRTLALGDALDGLAGGDVREARLWARAGACVKGLALASGALLRERVRADGARAETALGREAAGVCAGGEGEFTTEAQRRREERGGRR